MLWSKLLKNLTKIVPVLIVMLIITGLCGCAEGVAPQNEAVSEVSEAASGVNAGGNGSEAALPVGINDSDSEDVSGLDSDSGPADDKTADGASEADTTTDASDNGDNTGDNTSSFSVHYIDVGQGDCTLVCCDGRSMLIDAGPNDKGTAIQMYLMKQGIKALDYLVLTHPDSDHIGSADVIITKFNIKKVIMSPYPKENEYWKDVADAMDYRNYAWFVPKTGEKFDLGRAKVEILQSKLYDDSNNSSIILMVYYGDTRFLFTGDAEKEAESDLEKSGADIRADVYQAGHHGSNTASSESFVRAVAPEYAVISSGKGNSYGHPHKEPLDLFKKLGIKIFRLDEQSDVVAYSDGKTVTWSASPSDNYEAGMAGLTTDNTISPVTTDNVANGGTDRSNAAGDADKNSGNSDPALNSATESSGNDTNVSGNAGTSDNWEYGTAPEGASYIGNINNMKLHRADCDKLPIQKNQVLFDTLEEAENAGFTRDNQCKVCHPFVE